VKKKRKQCYLYCIEEGVLVLQEAAACINLVKKKRKQ